MQAPSKGSVSYFWRRGLGKTESEAAAPILTPSLSRVPEAEPEALFKTPVQLGTSHPPSPVGQSSALYSGPAHARPLAGYHFERDWPPRGLRRSHALPAQHTLHTRSPSSARAADTPEDLSPCSKVSLCRGRTLHFLFVWLVGLDFGFFFFSS